MKIALIGAGHLGKIHLKCIQNIDQYELIGFYDTDPSNAKAVSETFGIPYFDNIEELLNSCDVVDIVTPTVSHFQIASAALRKGKHVFLEKPITASPDEAKKLLALANEANVKTQVGHVERFNPAFLSVKDRIHQPMFIEAHRLAMFNPRGLDVPVVLDLMIHDIDLILSVVDSEVKKVSASGVSIIGSTPDIANARIEFANGCVANVTTSRISLKNMRKVRFFQKDAYISVDLLDKKSEVVSMHEVDQNDPFAMVLELGNGISKQISIEKPSIAELNAIQTELSSFWEAITYNKKTPVPFSDGTKALEVAYQIMEAIEKKLN